MYKYVCCLCLCLDMKLDKIITGFKVNKDENILRIEFWCSVWKKGRKGGSKKGDWVVVVVNVGSEFR